MSLGRRTAACLLVALVVAAAWLRLRGLDSLLPHWTYPDGYIVLGAFERVRAGMAFDAQQTTVAQYPFLLPRVAALLPGEVAAAQPASDLAASLALAKEPWMQIRLASVLISLFAVGCTYGVARRFLERGPALLAVAFVATSLLHVTFAPAQRPHASAAGTVALAVLAALHLRQRPSWLTHALAAASVGLAIGALQSGAATLLPWIVAWWLRDEKERSLGRNLAAWALGAMVIALCVRWFYPYQFDGTKAAVQLTEDGDVLSLAGHKMFLGDFNGLGFAVVAQTLFFHDPVPTVLAAVAVVVALVQLVRRSSALSEERRRDLCVVLAYVVPYVVVIGLYQHTFERFVMPLVPFVAIAAAWAISLVARKLARPLGSSPMFAGACALVLAFPAYVAWHLGSLRQAPDTFELAADWIRENVDPGTEAVYALQNIELPLFYSRGALAASGEAQRMYWSSFQKRAGAAGDPPSAYDFRRVERDGSDLYGEADERGLASLRDRGFDYVVSQPLGRNFHESRVAEMLKRLNRTTKLVAEFSSEAEPESKSRRVPALATGMINSYVAWRLLSTDHLGPKLEIRRL